MGRNKEDECYPLLILAILEKLRLIFLGVVIISARHDSRKKKRKRERERSTLRMRLHQQRSTLRVRLHQPSKLHSAGHTGTRTRIQQVAQSYLQILQLELQQVTSTCIAISPSSCSILVSQRLLGGISTLKKVLRTACSSVTITKTEVSSLNEYFQQSHFPKSLAQKPFKRWTWRHFVPIQRWNVSWTPRYMLQGSPQHHPWLEGKGLGNALTVVVPKSIQCIHSSTQIVQPTMEKMGVEQDTSRRVSTNTRSETVSVPSPQ